MPISYQLVIRVPEPLRLKIGAFGVLSFQAGWYVYTGSARTSMEARLRRHFSTQKKLRWHIDYLLAGDAVEIVDVRRSEKRECLLNSETAGVIPFPGFGASDCKSGCISHLKFSSSEP